MLRELKRFMSVLLILMNCVILFLKEINPSTKSKRFAAV